VKTGYQFTKAQPASEDLLDVPLGRHSLPNGQEVDHDVRVRLARMPAMSAVEPGAFLISCPR